MTSVPRQRNWKIAVTDPRSPFAPERPAGKDLDQVSLPSALGGTRTPNLLINAVGVVAFGDVATLSTDVMEDLFMTNTFIPIMIATEAMNTLSTGGVIVNISGVIAEQNLPGMVAYGASKAALRAFDEGLAREARRKGVRVIDARPPHTETGLAGRAIAGTTPKMGEGLEPAAVARVICDGIETGAADLGSGAFAG